jgi:hypothetical protein
LQTSTNDDINSLSYPIKIQFKMPDGQIGFNMPDGQIGQLIMSQHHGWALGSGRQLAGLHQA